MMVSLACSRLALPTALAALCLSGGKLNSNEPGAVMAKTPEESLAEIKAANEALIAKQKAALQRLEALQKEAEQLRIFVKRS